MSTRGVISAILESRGFGFIRRASRRSRNDIVGWIREGYDKASLADLAASAGKLVASGLVLRINPLDSLGSLVDEALRRAEVG